MKRRYWTKLAWACAFIVAPAYLVFSPQSPPPTSPTPAIGSRATSSLGSQGSANPEAQDLCNHLYRSVCQKRGETRDPTGAVRPDMDGELQALRTYEGIIREHPDWSREQVDEELVRTIFTPKRRARIQSAYHWVEQALERFINRQPEAVFTASEKKLLIQRLVKTELQLPPPASVYEDEPDLFTKNDVFYERAVNGNLRMRVGGAYVLNAKSWFNIVFTIAHEFAHAIDPCELRAARISIPAYDRISACFMTHNLVAARKTRQECGENDQLSETFADWIAVQIVSEALKSFATEFQGSQLVNAATNAVRDLCEQDDTLDELDLEFHPSPEIRINSIFGRNPEIRQVLGCPQLSNENDPLPEYCGFGFNPMPKKVEQL